MRTADDGAVNGCFLFTTGGLLLPALSETDGDGRELADLLRELRPMVHSIMGIGKGVRSSRRCFPFPRRTASSTSS